MRKTKLYGKWEEIKQHYLNDKSLNEVAEIYDVGGVAILNVLKKLNCPRRSEGSAVGEKNPRRVFDDKTEKEIKNNGLNIKKNGKVIARHSFSDGYYNALGNKVSIKSFETKENKIKIKFNGEITTSKSDSFYWSSPSQDTKTVSGAPTTNYGTQASSYVGTRSDADVRNMMGWFKFGGLLNDSANAFAIIDSAFLSIKYYDTKVGLCTLFTVTPIAGWSQINLTFANQPDSSLAYISDTLKSNSAGWWRFNITTIETAYHTGGALSGLDTTKGYIIMDINPSDPASNYMNYFNSENATDKPKKVVYYHAGVATGGYIGNQPLYDNKNIPIYDNKITPLYNKP